MVPLETYSRLCPPVGGPFLVNDSFEVCDFLEGLHFSPVLAFNLDVKDLFISVTQESLLRAITDSVDKEGIAYFQYETGHSLGGCLEFVQVYLGSLIF